MLSSVQKGHSDDDCRRMKADKPQFQSSLRKVDAGFTARFHRNLGLLSVANASRNLATLSRNEGLWSHEHPNDLTEATTTKVFNSWSKNSVIVVGDIIILNSCTILDCLEVFDFIYLFLLKEALPLDNLDSWTDNNPLGWPYDLPFYLPPSDDSKKAQG